MFLWDLTKFSKECLGEGNKEEIETGIKGSSACKPQQVGMLVQPSPMPGAAATWGQVPVSLQTWWVYEFPWQTSSWSNYQQVGGHESRQGEDLGWYLGDVQVLVNLQWCMRAFKLSLATFRKL